MMHILLHTQQCSPAAASLCNTCLLQQQTTLTAITPFIEDASESSSSPLTIERGMLVPILNILSFLNIRAECITCCEAGSAMKGVMLTEAGVREESANVHAPANTRASGYGPAWHELDRLAYGEWE
jgi:hypothetical protein